MYFNHRCNICIKDADGEAQGMTEGAALCICRFRKGVWQGAKRGIMVLHKEVKSGREVC